ncbi:MAG: DUF2630 family protein [Jatrophihabitans sp.]
MDDKSVLDHIHELVAAEKELRSAHQPLTSDDRRRLEKIEYDLDRTWDLLRQRRAREEFGENPDEAKERTEDEVERYLQ